MAASGQSPAAFFTSYIRAGSLTRKLSIARQALICGATQRSTLVQGPAATRQTALACGWPITQDMGWTRQTFALAMASISKPVLGHFGHLRRHDGGSLFGRVSRADPGAPSLYALGLAGSVKALSPTAPTAAAVFADHRRADRQAAGPGRHHLCRDLRRAGATDLTRAEIRLWPWAWRRPRGSFGQFFRRHDARSKPR